MENILFLGEQDVSTKRACHHFRHGNLQGPPPVRGGGQLLQEPLTGRFRPALRPLPRAGRPLLPSSAAVAQSAALCIPDDICRLSLLQGGSEKVGHPGVPARLEGAGRTRLDRGRGPHSSQYRAPVYGIAHVRGMFPALLGLALRSVELDGPFGEVSFD